MRQSILKLIFFSALLLSNASLYAMSDPSAITRFLETNECINCNLSGFNLSLGKPHTYAKLQSSNLSRSVLLGDFRMANFSHINGTETTFGCNLSGADFSHAKLMRASFNDDDLTDADFRGADVEGADFTNCNLIHARLNRSQIASAATFCDALMPDGTKGSCR